MHEMYAWSNMYEPYETPYPIKVNAIYGRPLISDCKRLAQFGNNLFSEVFDNSVRLLDEPFFISFHRLNIIYHSDLYRHWNTPFTNNLCGSFLILTPCHAMLTIICL